jgi:two-component system, cell cycle sensor histidine kinase and response regulator CckA
MEPRSDELRALSALDPALVSVASNSPENIMLIDLHGNIQYMNWTVDGVTLDDVVGTPVYNHVPEQFHHTISSCFERVLASGRPDGYETVYISEGGNVTYWESRVGPVEREGAIVGFAVISSNATQRRSADAERDRFFNLSVDMLFVAGFDGYFKRINPALERTLGFTEQELLASPLIEFVHSDDRARTAFMIDRLRAGEQVVDFENRCRAKAGGYRWLSWRAASDPGRASIYAVARDVTEQKALEDQLRHSQKMDGIGQLAGGVAHDFNNLLLAILSNTEFAQREARVEKRTEYLDGVRHAALRAAELTRQLLTFARRHPVNPIVLDSNELLDKLMSLLRRLIPESIEIEILPGEKIPLVHADPGQIEQVVLNLCVNARDAMPRGGHLTIQTENLVIDSRTREIHRWARPGRYLLLTVSDTGGGIDATIRDRVFEPFFTTKDAGSGTGLGLATVYAIVQQHEGEVRFHSQPGLGTTFEVYLPATDRKLPEPAKEIVSEVVGGSETVLVAEDEELVRNVVVQTLEDAGYHVLVARDGREAVRLFKNHARSVALVVLDVIMPRLTGPEAYSEILLLNASVPVIFTSGYSNANSFADVQRLGAKVFPKPYRPDDLLREVRRVLDRR